jgi:hypothetical protein
MYTGQKLTCIGTSKTLFQRFAKQSSIDGPSTTCSCTSITTLTRCSKMAKSRIKRPDSSSERLIKKSSTCRCTSLRSNWWTSNRGSCTILSWRRYLSGRSFKQLLRVSEPDRVFRKRRLTPESSFQVMAITSAQSFTLLEVQLSRRMAITTTCSRDSSSSSEVALPAYKIYCLMQKSRSTSQTSSATEQ